MHRYLPSLLLLAGSALLVDGCLAKAHADYAECRATCAQSYTDCVNEPQAEEAEVEAARQAACTQKSDLCFSDCENLKPSMEQPEPQTNPNIIIKPD